MVGDKRCRCVATLVGKDIRPPNQTDSDDQSIGSALAAYGRRCDLHKMMSWVDSGTSQHDNALVARRPGTIVHYQLRTTSSRGTGHACRCIAHSSSARSHETSCSNKQTKMQQRRIPKQWNPHGIRQNNMLLFPKSFAHFATRSIYFKQCFTHDHGKITEKGR